MGGGGYDHLADSLCAIFFVLNVFLSERRNFADNTINI